MNEMIERVARAMEARAAQEPCTIEDVARAAIEAMRVPGPDYCAAVVRALACYPDKLHCDAVKQVHEQWISEALR